jgi:hypothetical protein
MKMGKDKLVDFDDIIRQASQKVDYYSKSIDSKISDIKEGYFDYIKKFKEAVDANNTNKTPLVLPDNDWDLAMACINSLQNDKYVQNLLFPVNEFMEPLENIYCEDAMFIDFIVIYKEKQCVTLPFKMKIDN